MCKILIIFSGPIFCLNYKCLNSRKIKEINPFNAYRRNLMYSVDANCICNKIRSKIYQFKARFCVTFISEHPVHIKVKIAFYMLHAEIEAVKMLLFSNSILLSADMYSALHIIKWLSQWQTLNFLGDIILLSLYLYRKWEMYRSKGMSNGPISSLL